MLQSIRDRIQSRIISALVVLAIIFFALWGFYNYLAPIPSQAVATIDGESITQQDFERTYQRLKQNNQNLNEQATVQLREQALNQLILKYILTRNAQNRGYRVGDSELAATLTEIPAFQVEGQFSKQRFYDVLASLAYSKHTFIQDLKDVLLIQQGRIGIVDSAFILPEELHQILAQLNQTRDFTYLTLEAKRKKDVHVSKQEALQFYLNHKKQFVRPEQVRVEYIELVLNDLTKSLKPTTKQLNQFYWAHQSAYRKDEKLLPFDQVRQQVERDFAQKEAIEQFKTKRDQLSDLVGRSSLNTMGNQLKLKVKTTSLFNQSGGSDDLTKNLEIIKAAFSKTVLSGNNSPMIEITPDHLVILHLKEHQSSGIYSFNEVRDKIIDQLTQEARRKKIQDEGARLIQQLKQDPNKARQYTWHKISSAKRYDTPVETPIVAQVFKLSFPNDTVAGVSLANGDYVIVKLLGIYPGDTKNSEQYRNTLEDNVGAFEYALYVRSLMQRAQIKLNG
jgi:SurA N-terminal domain/PPIC-type PPIASE domain